MLQCNSMARLVAEYETREPFLLCNYLGLKVFRPSLIGIRGFYFQEDGVDMIFVSSQLEAAVADFVCAHELGHYINHRGLNRMFMDSRTFMVPDKYENEADRFALSLLRPKLVEQCCSDWELAECLNVSTCNLNTRLEQLNVFDF